MNDRRINGRPRHNNTTVERDAARKQLAAALARTAGGDRQALKLVYRDTSAKLSAVCHPARTGGAAMYPSKNIIQNAVNSKDHTTLVAAVKAAGLVDTLQGAGPFTVFAPTNDAFAQLPKGTVESLLKPENKDKLVKILTYHVVSADAMAGVVKKMIKDDGGKHTISTVSGGKLIAMMKGDKIALQDENGGVATVTIADVKQSNGVIHVIDHVLLPK